MKPLKTNFPPMKTTVKTPKRLQTAVVAMLMICTGLMSCSKQSNVDELPAGATKSNAKSSAANTLLSGPIVAAHRANNLIKVDEIIAAGVKSLEVDIFVGTRNNKPTLLVGHEAATATGQTLEEYFANLNQKMPNFEYLWLDCKDLNGAANEQVFMTTLNKMDSLYSIKSRVLVESQYISYLVNFKQQNWNVSYYCNWSSLSGKTSAQQLTILNGWHASMTTYGIDGISYDATVDTPMKNYFINKTVGTQPVRMYAWALSRYYGEANLATKLAVYNHLSVLLITFKSNNNT
ncbi:hypothetical protein DBR43_04915 [Pedobacter sp. KBW06]|nr:hypothetical protein DBR43_04915 [Pedobacter sp. KBW06]